MITVLCLTPCVDETIYLPTFVMGGTNRPSRKQSVAGGKGVNVAVTLAQMAKRSPWPPTGMRRIPTC